MKPIKPHQVTPVPSEEVAPATPNPEATRKRLLELRPNGKPAHPYTKAGDTDLAASFKRIRKQLKEQEAALHKAATTVCELKRKAKP